MKDYHPEGTKGPLPGFSREINKVAIKSETLGGISLKDLEVGQKIEVQTEHHVYLIERRADGFYISGDPKYFPISTKVTIFGAKLGGTIIKSGFIGRGLSLEISHPKEEDKRVYTSEVTEVKMVE